MSDTTTKRHATIEDFARLWKAAQEDELGRKARDITRISLHPDDFRLISESAVFSPAPTEHRGAGVHFRGKLWGADVVCDPRNEKGIAYVVGIRPGGGQQIGNRFPIVPDPEIPRRTAWERVLDDHGPV